MAHDLVIVGGTVVDGTGADARAADVVIDDGRITAVVEPGSVVDAADTIDATGLLVTPGFVDIHTHFDGQATWDSELTPTSWHGVTTIVMGNCGVGFAPVEDGKQDWLIGLMEGVEDIPGTALAEGIDWQWETFPEYLDVLARRRWTVDVGAQIAHGPVRAYVMGERGARNEPASPEEIARMKAIVAEAVDAGALGFTMSRTIGHIAIDGEPVPGTFAAEDEIFGICGALGELGKGVVELAPTGSAGEDIINPAKEVDWMRRLSLEIGRPVTFALLQVDAAPDLWRELMETSRKAVEEGADLWAQVAGRPTGLLSGFRTRYSFFDQIPEYAALKIEQLPWDELKKVVSDPEFRARIIECELDEPTAKLVARASLQTFVLGDPPDYEPGPEKSLAAIAEATGRSPLEVAYDAMLENDCEGLLYVPILGYSNGNLDHVREMLMHPRSAVGLADGGAHCSVICDASMPTYMLTHWTRDRSRGERLPLEFVVRKQTHDTARLYGMTDRGTLEPGMLADVNLIDYDRLRVLPPVVVADLPAGGTRVVQGAEGYVATIKRGVVTYRNGEATGARPGELVRSDG
ncbi:MAG TPA: amidohydrolase family protein [Mycobacteriales bacterium]|nr:amidohydrolase family protein [Mycobacteriales bacterium]